MSFVVARMQNRGAEHIPPKPNQVNQLMMQLVYEYNHDDDVDPYLREARFHIRFERIHPFEDGNGRTGRILVNRGLLQAGLAPVVVPFERRAEYLAMLAGGDPDGLAEMFRRGSSRSRPPGMTSISTVRVGRAWAPCCCRGWGSGARAALLIRSPSSTSRSYAVKDTGNARLACPIIGTSVQA